MLYTQKLVNQINRLSALYDELYPLIEGLPFNAPGDTSESNLHYFAQAANACNESEEMVKNLEEFIGFRCDGMVALLNKVIEWDLKDECGLNEEDREVYRKVMAEKRQALKELGKKRAKV